METVARSRYIPRSLTPVLRRAVREFPALVLTGPRQSGKTTLLKHLFAARFDYVSLEPPDVRAAASRDPRAFLELHPPPVILDEVHYAPDLLPYIKERIDEHRSRRGQYLLSGSQNLLLMEQVTESLAGRTAVLKLLPLTQREAQGRPQARLPWEPGRRGRAAPRGAGRQAWDDFLRGYYPELVARPRRDRYLWQAGYVQTYLERDVRQLRQVGDLGQFQDFLRLLAARSAQLLNLTALARDLGIAVNTAKAWLAVLQATYQVIVLRPYFANIGKRLVKMPKVYFTDVGTLCYLTGLRDPLAAAAGPLGGPIVETAVVGEIYKSLLHRGQEPKIWFWRTAAGAEVDILVEAGGRLVPVEVKLTATPKPALAAGLRAIRRDLGPRAASGWLIHLGDQTLPLGEGNRAFPFAGL